MMRWIVSVDKLSVIRVADSVSRWMSTVVASEGRSVIGDSCSRFG